MEQVLELRCQLEQNAIIKEIMFGGMIVMFIQMAIGLVLTLNIENE